MKNEEFFKSELTANNIKDLANRRWNSLQNRKTKKTGNGYFVDKDTCHILIYRDNRIVSDIGYKKSYPDNNYIIVLQRILFGNRTLYLRIFNSAGFVRYTQFYFSGTHASISLLDENFSEIVQSRKYQARLFVGSSHEEYTILKDNALLDVYRIDLYPNGAVKKVDGSYASMLPLR